MSLAVLSKAEDASKHWFTLQAFVSEHLFPSTAPVTQIFVC